MKLLTICLTLIILSGCHTTGASSRPDGGHDPYWHERELQRQQEFQRQHERMHKQGPVYEQMCRDSWIHLMKLLKVIRR